MKICLVNNLYGSFARGGAESAVSGYAKLLKAAGHEIIIITTRPQGIELPDTDDKLIYLGGLSSLYYHLGGLPIFFRFLWHLGNLFNLLGFFQLKKILADEKPDLVMTHNLLGIGFLTPLAITSLKIRHFHFLHDIQLLHPSGLMIYGKEGKVDASFAKIYQAITKRFFGSPEKIISPSAWLLHEHEVRKYFPSSKKLILPNPILDLSLPTKNIHSGGGKKIFKFIYVGQIENHKGVLFLAETFTKLDSDSAELIIIGDGSQTEALKIIISPKQNIKFFGRIRREEVLAAMSQADCLVVPSLCYENTPSVIIEAAVAGLPVIASSLGGIPELLADQLTFRPGDGTEMLAKLKWALDHPDELIRLADDSRSKQITAGSAIILNRLGL
jgi:glycosyltransferase involved in cell wall biosynthesis